MKKKSKLRTIFQAFTSEVPTDEAWFQERLETCEGCDYNSDNKESSDLTFKQKSTINLVCGGEPICTACGCCLVKKLGQKTENCGLINVEGEAPKWRALAVETASVKDINIEILEQTAESVDLDLGGKVFIVRLGDVTQTVREIVLRISREAGLKITKLSASCGCTVPKQEEVDGTSAKIRVKIDTSKFNNNQRFEKTLTVLYQEGTQPKQINVKFVGHKKQ